MHTLVKCGEHAPMDVLISLKQLKTLCDSSVAVGDLVQYGCDVTMMEILQTFPADAEIARLAFLVLGYFAEKAPEHVTLSQELLDLLARLPRRARRRRQPRLLRRPGALRRARHRHRRPAARTRRLPTARPPPVRLHGPHQARQSLF